MSRELQTREDVLYNDIIYRAIKLDVLYLTEKKRALKDIMSAGIHFNMDLKKWISSNDKDFVEDFVGIRNNIVRNSFPSNEYGGFVPKFKKDKER